MTPAEPLTAEEVTAIGRDPNESHVRRGLATVIFEMGLSPEGAHANTVAMWRSSLLVLLAADFRATTGAAEADWQQREPNHYDWFLPDNPTGAVDDYLDEFEAKLRESLTDYYVHDMAQSVLPLIAAYRQAREGSVRSHGVSRHENPEDVRPRQGVVTDPSPRATTGAGELDAARVDEIAGDVTTEIVEAYTLNRDNRQSRWHEETPSPSHRESWACVSLTDAVYAVEAAAHRAALRALAAKLREQTDG